MKELILTLLRMAQEDDAKKEWGEWQDYYFE
jgi:hypothetical protein